MYSLHRQYCNSENALIRPAVRSPGLCTGGYTAMCCHCSSKRRLAALDRWLPYTVTTTDRSH